MERRRYVAEAEEIGRIDYFLDQLARAVERGEVHRSSYDLLAPRYLARREELVAIVTGAAPEPWTAPASVSEPGPRLLDEADPTAASQPVLARPVREPKPVPWTTVLLFLGAFLVIVASAIFAIAVWDLLPVAGKLAFMGALTAGFYAAGFWARTRLKLRAGSVALTTVASAMLLFDGWILISGYDLEGPLPWAGVLIVCSAIYWFTEVRLAERFFGVIGAAAQVGWWWLLGEGLGLAEPMRLAGLAVLALVWQIASERGRDDKTVGSLAQGLSWAAPVLATIVVLGVLRDLALVRSAGFTEAALAAVGVGGAGAVLWRSPLLRGRGGQIGAAIAQLPLFAVVWTASGTTGESWALVALFAAMALSYDSIALMRAGAPFAILGLLAELSLAIEVCVVLDASTEVTVAVIAALGAMWALTPRLAARVREVASGAEETAIVARVGSIAVLALASMLTPIAQEAMPLAGFPISGNDAALAVAVLAAWGAAAVASGSAVTWGGVVLFSYYAGASVVAWAWPERDPGFYALGMMAVSAAWLVGSRVFTKLRDDHLGDVVLWGTRALIVVVAFVGFVAEQAAHVDLSSGFFLGFVTWYAVTVVAAAAALLAADAAESRSTVVACAAVVGGLTASGLAARAVLAPGQGATPAELLAARDALPMATGVTTGIAAAVMVAVCWVLRRRRGSTGLVVDTPLAVATTSTVFGTAWVFSATGGHADALAVGAAIVAVLWAVLAAMAAPWLTLAASASGLLSVASALSWYAVPPWVTLVVFAIGGFVLAAPELALASASGRRRIVYESLAITGGLAHVWLVVAGVVSSDLLPQSASWWQIGEQGLVIALLVLGVHVLAHAAKRDFEPAYYLGFGAVLLAFWTELNVLDTDQFQLYSTTLALYLAGCGLLYTRIRPGRRHPVAVDAAVVLVGLAYPLLLALRALPDQVLVRTGWVIVLSLVAIGAGIGVKARWYLFGGSAALAVVALYRSFSVLAELWWLVLGLIGVAMLVIALTWERQRMIVTGTRDRLRRSFEGWR